MTDHAPVPPNNLDAEERVLGAILLSARAIEDVLDVVFPSDFYRASHGHVYAVMVAMYAAGEPLDAITLSDRLDEKGILAEVGGKERIHELAALAPSSSNVAHHAVIVREMATLRGLTIVGEQIQRLGWERDAPGMELVGRAEEMVFDLSRGRIAQNIERIGVGLPEAITRMEEVGRLGQSIVGLPTGLTELDELTLGLQPGNLVVIGARPSMGKSALALAIVQHVSLELGRPTLTFTLEMSRDEVRHRILSSESSVNGLRLRDGRLDKDAWRRVMQASSRISDAPIFVEESASLTMAEIRAKARRFASKNPDLALVVVDYLQLMRSGEKAEGRVQEVAQISRSLKILSSELAIPVLAVSQLSRGVESRHDQRPVLSDLRESGQIEQDADIVMFLYRDAYYNPEDAIVDGTEGVAELNVAKQRNGPIGTVKVAFVKQYARFGNLAPTHAGV